MGGLCTTVVSLVPRLCESAGGDVEAKVFFMKMQGDYYRYMAENTSSDSDKVNAASSYQAAWEEAVNNKMDAAHPVLLGLALNRSVFYFEVLRQKDDAIHTATQALQNATQALQNAATQQQQLEAQQIMALLSDNLTLWGATPEGGNDGTAVEDF